MINKALNYFVVSELDRFKYWMMLKKNLNDEKKRTTTTLDAKLDSFVLNKRREQFSNIETNILDDFVKNFEMVSDEVFRDLKPNPKYMALV
jgi:hypothetical protein